MSVKDVYYGPLNNNYKEKIIEKAKKYLIENKGDKFFYILPSGNLLNKYRNMFLKSTKGTLDLNIITFDDIVKMIANGKKYIFIDDPIKDTIIYKVVKKLEKEDKLKYYKKQIESEGFIQDISYILGTIKRSLITPEEFHKKIPYMDKFKEMGLIYDCYQRFITEKNMLDTEEVFIKALEEIKSSNTLFNNLEFVIIDEFFDFRPQELEILKAMALSDIDIYMNIPYKVKEESYTVINIIEKLRNMGFQITNIEGEDKDFFTKIGNDDFGLNSSSYKKNEDIKLIKADTRRLEIKKVCELIKKENKDISLDNIALILGNDNKYRELVIDIFNQENIPISLREEKMLIDIPLVKELINILELRLTNYNKITLLKALKSGYMDVCDGNDKDKMEYVFHILNLDERCTKDKVTHAIGKEKNRLRLLKGNSENPNRIENFMEDLSNLEYILELLFDKVSEMEKVGPIDEIIDKYMEIIEFYDITDRIKILYESTKDYSILHRDLSAISRFKEILNEVKEICKPIYGKGIALEDLYRLIKRLCENESIYLNNLPERCVNVLTPSTARGSRFSTVFIMGMIQGEYPNVINKSWFFRDEDIEIFKNMGIDFKSYQDRLDKEKLLFANAISRARKKLYFSYCNEDNSGKALISSPFLEQFIDVFKGEKIEDKIKILYVDKDYIIKDDLDTVTTTSDLIKSVIYNYYKNGKGDIFKHIPSAYVDTINDIVNKLSCELKRYQKGFNEYDGVMDEKSIKDEIYERFSQEKMSITQLETYGKCPFRYLLEYILQIKPLEKDIDDFTPMDKGDIYHRVLAQYYRKNSLKLREIIINNGILNVEKTKEELKKILDSEIYSMMKIRDKRLWDLRKNHMSKILLNVIKKDVERLKVYKMIPREFELGFGYNDDFVLKLENGTASFIGKIDRIDVDELDGKVIIYDYKTSKGKGINDMLKGISLQTPIYILYQQSLGKDVVGGGYITIKDGEMYTSILRDKYKDRFKSKKGLDKEEWDMLFYETKRYIDQYLKGIYTGDFRLNPKECTVFCPYKNVCRYDIERINGKESGDEIN
ncbi:PD-(D/E)XK nuclease family protein [Clostridiisalibacter paucivorans]|uniref:PD-(D/E)XK nuclease family protein n=1 Tax=Clostridiisalibacter paucivorans TaxID=408753 RepID=UPI00047BCE2C|nr:PD-(D/E)XK nuclease family protein [Clostridiisalibacter paucivorans]